MNTRLYTSRYNNKNLANDEVVKIGITRGFPKFRLPYQLKTNIKSFGPPSYLFNTHDREKFTPRYFDYMDSIGIDKVKEMLKIYGYGTAKEMALLCYEDVREEGKWCHRLVFAEWWEVRTGEKIEEYPDSSPDPMIKIREKQEKEKQQKELEKQQISLF